MQKMERMPGDAIHVCVDAYPNRVLQGRLQSAAWVGEMPFVSLMDFFKQVEHLLDEQLPPQAFTTMRRFGPVVKPEKTHGEVEQSASGKLATFYVRILFRQNASWQGTVLWSEGGQEERFRSALELALRKLFQESISGIVRATVDKLSEELHCPADELVVQFYTIALVGTVESWLLGEVDRTPEELIQFADTMLQDHMRGIHLRMQTEHAK